MNKDRGQRRWVRSTERSRKRKGGGDKESKSKRTITNPGFVSTPLPDMFPPVQPTEEKVDIAPQSAPSSPLSHLGVGLEGWVSAVALMRDEATLGHSRWPPLIFGAAENRMARSARKDSKMKVRYESTTA
ncbi:hypothetical protein FA13DRAFT_1174941 [Coprinellus micaceus]|uniref:Uncharacterized protein n=1 Tax=Coprinellus micaceus TaxID=71717 RepID=A0A4Y7SUF8_COPMI|nr:hypothetical protein FA13DRAFT_1174941 [Coprinellus micaceus]